MQTTLRISDALYRQAKAKAASLGISLTQFLEEAVRAKLHEPPADRVRRRIRLPVSSATGGLVLPSKTLEELVEAADLAEDTRAVRGR
jgi:hypothetical protein